ncbi:MBL fold metallo-hydrolase [Gillisia sp. M10.2A]|uniref:MBL fold metallo-hydrolase n=1 Tax=Gillisia lutea TaxID=2909668 RepID=A0ABS9EBX6_9FLAO|nr:MBL fold metallo-hydrolase [Gillisia lutea]MCF4100390.1 MBL fold metallo-hydrolase [Gillisia lutea]
MKKSLILMFVFIGLISCKNDQKKEEETNLTTQNSIDSQVEKKSDSLVVIPVSHASFAIQLNGKTIYFDPVGGAAAYSDLPEADLIVITDIHGDHMDSATLDSIAPGTTIVAPKAVKDKLPSNLQGVTQAMSNGDINTYFDIQIEAIPMYNLREEAKEMHTKGRGNGYVLSYKGKRIYVSGDTEDIPEMRSLKDIDIAFVCMNLPYTMPVESAIDAVLDFKPKKVYPYHYRGKDGYSDVAKFKTEVEKANSNIEVELLNWYPEKAE